MIESTNNPKVKQARALRRRRERERLGRIVVEGGRLVEDALATGGAPDVLFYTEAAMASPRVAALVAAHSAVAWAVTETVMADLAETVTPQGIAAIVALPQLAWPSQPTLLLVADQVRDPGNLGTLVRAAAAAGVEGLIAPQGTVDAWGDKVLRAGMGAHFRLPIRSAMAWDEAAALLQGLVVRVADAHGERRYDEADWTLPSALVVGGEATGVGEAAQPYIAERIAIPMARAVESLNAAMAGSVILFEAQRQRRTTRR